MLLPRLQPPLRAALTSIARSSASSGGQQANLNEAFAHLSLITKNTAKSPSLTFVRHASHAQQGAVNKAKDGPGKRLGAKRSGEQYVIPGNIIFRQRGTHWFPGENCAMGRDHTIYATQSGYVKYYKDPEKNPKKQYIGVVFERGQVLPLPRNSMRRRRLGMITQKIEAPVPATSSLIGVEGGDGKGDVDVRTDLVVDADGNTGTSVKQTPKKVVNVQKKFRKGEEGRNLTLRPGYMYREANWEIGRAAERAKVKVQEFKPRDRWTAWRKATARRAKTTERRGLSRKMR